MAKLVVKPNHKDIPAQEVQLKPGANRFGRDSTSDHMFFDPAISGRHCEILVDGEFIFVRDLESTNGTYIDGEQVKESMMYSGQTLRIGPVEMVLDAPVPRVALPEIPKPKLKIAPVRLADGFLPCLKHSNRHGVWECTQCHTVHCDECIRKLRRVGGVHMKLCPECGGQCRLSAWSEMMKSRKKGFFNGLAGKVKGMLHRNTRPLDN